MRSEDVEVSFRNLPHITDDHIEAYQKFVLWLDTECAWWIDGEELIDLITTLENNYRELKFRMDGLEK